MQYELCNHNIFGTPECPKGVHIFGSGVLVQCNKWYKITGVNEAAAKLCNW